MAKTKTACKNEINYEFVNKYLTEILPLLRQDVNDNFSDLKNLTHRLEREDFPPRIELLFSGKNQISDYKKEIEKNQADISSKVGEIAKKHDLRADGGVFTESWDRNNKRFLKWTPRLGGYTFKPHYQNFKK